MNLIQDKPLDGTIMLTGIKTLYGDRIVVHDQPIDWDDVCHRIAYLLNETNTISVDEMLDYAGLIVLKMPIVGLTIDINTDSDDWHWTASWADLTEK